MIGQSIREQPRQRCGFCRQGKPEHSLCYDERGGKRVELNSRETLICTDCRDVIVRYFTEIQLAVLPSLKPLREHSNVALWLTYKSVRPTATAADFFAEHK